MNTRLQEMNIFKGVTTTVVKRQNGKDKTDTACRKLSGAG
jgi:hypothetical protein